MKKILAILALSVFALGASLQAGGCGGGTCDDGAKKEEKSK